MLRIAPNHCRVMELASEKKCEFIDLKFVDVLGRWQHLTLTISKLSGELFEQGVGFDGSSIRGFQSVNSSDMLLIPDADTVFIDPVHECPTLSFICDVVDPVTKENYSRDPRHIARKAESYLTDSGVADVSYWGPELEFFIFDNVQFDTNSHESYYHINASEGLWNSGDNGRNQGYFIRNKQGYFSVPPNDHLVNLRSKIAKAMMQAGLQIEMHHHEVASGGQTELGMHYGTLLRQADNTLLNKYIAKNIAMQNNYTVTFMPKPLFLDNGNAMHVHMSLWKDAGNLFYDPEGYAGLSQTAKHYIGGLLAHSPALLAFCAPSTNSYRRLKPGYEAPVKLAYSQGNRSASVRIPVCVPSPNAKRIEYRCPDSTSNPYLAFAAILMAGIDGIKNKIDPGDPVEDDIYGIGAADAGRIKSVPGSLGEALEALEEDNRFLLAGGVFTPDIVDTWIAYKRKYELDPLALRPHPYEFNLYYDA